MNPGAHEVVGEASSPPQISSRRSLSFRRHRGVILAAVFLFAALISLIAFISFRRAPPAQPVTISFSGPRVYMGSREFTFIITNNTSLSLQCGGRISVTRGLAETEHAFNVFLAGRAKSTIPVTALTGTQPAQVRSVLTRVVGQHSRWFCIAGTLLEKVGIHVYHTNSSSTSPIKVAVGTPPQGSAPVSGFLSWQPNVTNDWIIP